MATMRWTREGGRRRGSGVWRAVGRLERAGPRRFHPADSQVARCSTSHRSRVWGPWSCRRPLNRTCTHSRHCRRTCARRRGPLAPRPTDCIAPNHTRLPQPSPPVPRTPATRHDTYVCTTPSTIVHTSSASRRNPPTCPYLHTARLRRSRAMAPARQSRGKRAGSGGLPRRLHSVRCACPTRRGVFPALILVDECR
ncbi:hypothetical protein B0H10DRAFT_2047389 [Mycena sp. CBHHK59/15]|nr:hypothetical protein B0H10DRAFT_2047389 [Mycena sp. CBHHK59/15]